MDNKNVKLLDLEATKELVTKLTPSNKEVLDKLSDKNGNLQYNEIALLNGEKVTRAQYDEMVTNGTLKDITYIVTDDSSDVENDEYVTKEELDNLSNTLTLMQETIQELKIKSDAITIET